MDITQKKINDATHNLIEIYKYTELVNTMENQFSHAGINMWGCVDKETGERLNINEGQYLEMSDDLKLHSEVSNELKTYMEDTFLEIGNLFKEKGLNIKTIAKKLKAIIDITHNSYIKDTDEMFINKDGKPFVIYSVAEEYLHKRLENIKPMLT